MLNVGSNSPGRGTPPIGNLGGQGQALKSSPKDFQETAISHACA